jgi:hypothetical protein
MHVCINIECLNVSLGFQKQTYVRDKRQQNKSNSSKRVQLRQYCSGDAVTSGLKAELS